MKVDLTNILLSFKLCSIFQHYDCNGGYHLQRPFDHTGGWFLSRLPTHHVVRHPLAGLLLFVC